MEPLDGIQAATCVADVARAEERINHFKMYSAVLLGHESPAQAAENHELGCRNDGSSRSAGHFDSDNPDGCHLDAVLVCRRLRGCCACTIQMGGRNAEILARDEVSRRRRTRYLAGCDLTWSVVRPAVCPTFECSCAVPTRLGALFPSNRHCRSMLSAPRALCAPHTTLRRTRAEFFDPNAMQFTIACSITALRPGSGT